MGLNLVKVGAPSYEAVLVSEARAHFRVSHVHDDPYIGGLVIAAREQAEKDINAAIVEQEYDYFTERPLSRRICIPRQPVVSITSIKYQDADDQEQTLDPGNYTLKAYRDPPEVELDEDFLIPPSSDAVIRFKAGYAKGGEGTEAANVPQLLKQAIMFLADSWYIERAAISELQYKEVPAGYMRIVGKHRIRRFA
jgi:uncharacterized phiE125 gp8 family phage protein